MDCMCPLWAQSPDSFRFLRQESRNRTPALWVFVHKLRMFNNKFKTHPTLIMSYHQLLPPYLIDHFEALADQHVSVHTSTAKEKAEGDLGKMEYNLRCCLFWICSPLRRKLYFADGDWNMIHCIKLPLSLVLWDSLYLMSTMAEHNVFH